MQVTMVLQQVQNIGHCLVGSIMEKTSEKELKKTGYIMAVVMNGLFPGIRTMRFLCSLCMRLGMWTATVRLRRMWSGRPSISWIPQLMHPAQELK